MSSDSDDAEVVETKILPDKKWIESLAKEEIDYFKENQIPFEDLEDRKVVCSACFKQGNHKQKGFFVRHPGLGVPVCKACKTFYFEGSWRKDDEGKFEYCGWCAQGGDLFCCTKKNCPNAFCTKCVKRNLGRKIVTKIAESEEWKCFECVPEQLREQRLLYFSILAFWKKVDEKNDKKKAARVAREKAKNRTDCLTKTYQLASQSNLIAKNFVTKKAEAWAKNPDFTDKVAKEESAEEFAKYLALSQKNLNQLKQRFLENLDEDLGANKARTEKLDKIIEDLDSISNGHLETIIVKKEKVKFQVLQNSSDEETTAPKANGKKSDTPEEVVLSDTDELASSSDEGSQRHNSDNDSDAHIEQEVISRKVSTKKVKKETPKKEKKEKEKKTKEKEKKTKEKTPSSTPVKIKIGKKKENKKDLVDSEDDFDLTTNDPAGDAGEESEDSKDLVDGKKAKKDTPEVNGKECNKKGIKNEVLAASSDEEIEKETSSKKKGAAASKSEKEEEDLDEKNAKKEALADDSSDEEKKVKEEVKKEEIKKEVLADSSEDEAQKETREKKAKKEALFKAFQKEKASEDKKTAEKEKNDKKVAKKALALALANSSDEQVSEEDKTLKKGKKAKKDAKKEEALADSSDKEKGSEEDETPKKEEKDKKDAKKEVLANSSDEEEGSKEDQTPKKGKKAKKEALADSSDKEKASDDEKTDKKGKTSKVKFKVLKNSSDEEDLANSSDEEASDEEKTPKKGKKAKKVVKKVKKDAKKEVFSNSSDEEESSEEDETPENSPQKKLREKFNNLIEKIDVKSDEKLNSKPEVGVQRLEADIEEKLKEGENSIKLKGDKEVEKKPRTKSVKSEAVKFDDEISRLCDLGALKKLTKKSSRSKPTKKSDKKSKMKNGKKSVPESDLESLSSGDEVEEISSKKKSRSRKPMPKSKTAKDAVLGSSESDLSENEENKSAKNKAKKAKKDESEEDSSAEKSEKSSKKSSRSKKKSDDPKFMKVKLDETDSDAEESKAKKRREKAKRKVIEDSDSDIEEVKVTKKKGKRGKKRKNADSSGDDFEDNSDEEEEEEKDKNSDDDDSDIGTKKKVAKGKKGKKGKGKKRKKKDGSDSSSGDDPNTSDDEPRPKKKRKRIKKNAGSGSSAAEEEEDEDGDGESPTKGGRKDIRKILKDKKLTKATKTAAQTEQDRRKRVADKQAVFNELIEIKDNTIVKELPLDIDPETKEHLIKVHPDLCAKLKPHQARGIKFMFESVFESKSQLEKGKVPGGAILAHCMGLGKTLQCIGLIHTLMTNFPDHVKHVLVLAPVNTLKNWEEEFYKWLVDDLEDDINVNEISGEKDNWGRTDRLRYWRKNGGAMIMGYDMFRNLTNETAKKFKKKQKEVFKECLLDPGPDLVICDEGHVLKNTKSQMNIAMNRIKTRRRIILTGTPLQNNLSEYFAMVDFVKPKLLGTFAEFRNRFVNPITNGQSSDSTDRDVRVMKKRSFILNDLLKGCLQRLDYNVLVPFLQPKHEYVLCIKLTDFQEKLYKHYLENFAKAGQIGADGKLEGGKKGGLFYDVQNLSRVWNHPYILLKAKERQDIKRMFEDDAEDDERFVNDESLSESEAKTTESESSNSDEEVIKKRKVTTRGGRSERRGSAEDLVKGLDSAKADELAAHKGWWAQFMKDPEEGEKELLNLELGSKMVLLMDILKESYLIGDKVLVFSQSLLSLDLIEKFLSIAAYDDTYGTWNHGKDYFRMDGSTGPDVRKKCCSYFNDKKHTDMRLFLISTKAGGLGINLVAANRVIIFDASWNPAHDVQSIFRVYRFGQEKPVYVYRFLAKGTMEEKIYDRQVTKQSLSARVVDEQQIERHFTMNELAELYQYKEEPKEEQPTIKVPQDKLLAELIIKHKDAIWKIHDHDTLLEHQDEQTLTEEERKAAWDEYENEKKGVVNMVNTNNLNIMNNMMTQINPELIRQQYRMQYPHLTEDQINQATRAYMMQIQSGFTGRVDYDRSHYAQEMARARQHQQQLYPGMYNSARGARPATEVSQQDLSKQAQQLQILQRMAQLRRAQEIQAQQQRLQNSNVNMAKVQMNRPQVVVKPGIKPAAAAAAQARPGASSAGARPKLKSPKKPPETIDLSDDDDDDEDEDDEEEEEEEEDKSSDDEISEVTPAANGDAADDDSGEIMLDGAPETE